MSKSKAVEHVVLRVSTMQGEPDTVFWCRHCDGQTMVTPTGPTGDQQHGEVSLFALQKRAAAFTLMHEDCAKPSRQLPLLPVPERIVDDRYVGVTPHHTTGLRDRLAERIVADAIAERQANGRLVERIGNAGLFRHVAEWAAREIDNTEGAPIMRPLLLQDAIDEALKAAKEKHEAIAEKARAAKMGQDGNTANARKPRSQKRPLVLHVHASNDTHPKKSAPNHLHRTVSTVEQADSLRGIEGVQSVKLLGGVWDIPLLTYLKTQVLGPMDVPVSEGKVTAAATEPVADGAL